MNLFQGFQSSVENQFSFIKEKLDSIQDRMGVLENRQGMLKKEISASKMTSARKSFSGKGRKCVTPAALQISYIFFWHFFNFSS